MFIDTAIKLHTYSESGQEKDIYTHAGTTMTCIIIFKISCSHFGKYIAVTERVGCTLSSDNNAISVSKLTIEVL